MYKNSILRFELILKFTIKLICLKVKQLRKVTPSLLKVN